MQLPLEGVILPTPHLCTIDCQTCNSCFILAALFIAFSKHAYVLNVFTGGYKQRAIYRDLQQKKHEQTVVKTLSA